LSRPSFAYAIWLVSRVISVDTEITGELRAKVGEIVNKRVLRPYRFLFLASPAGQLGTHLGGFGHVLLEVELTWQGVIRERTRTGLAVVKAYCAFRSNSIISRP
jgi:hypothetical protein